jgi:predicted O-methyltransferase YrrM
MHMTISQYPLSIDDFHQLPIIVNRSDHLLTAASQAPSEGVMVECGVFKGQSINLLAEFYPQKKIVGFDSFEGLPEAWERSESSTYEPGHFALKQLPVVPGNVELIAGFFDKTLPEWASNNKEPISLLHLDADLYSSTVIALEAFSPFLNVGTVIVFDEICDWNDSGIYPKWREGEWKALNEWLQKTGRRLHLLNRDSRFAASMRIVE